MHLQQLSLFDPAVCQRWRSGDRTWWPVREGGLSPSNLGITKINGCPPQRAAELVACMRSRDLPDWPPPQPSVEERRARWGTHVARFGLGPDRWDTPWGPVTPYTTSEFHPDPARRTTFYLGVGHPNHLNESPVPLFIAATTLARYRRRGDDFPVKMNSAGWAGDSGAYAALILRTSPEGHPWFAHPDEYGSMWTRFVEDVGPPDFVGIQDWPCEAQCLRRTRSTVREHQEATLHNYLYLAEEFPFVPWLPTLQGWHPWDYVEHYEMYRAAGVELAGARVGIGSVCRRGSQRGVARVLGTLAPLAMRMHGFGVSINALRIACQGSGRSPVRWPSVLLVGGQQNSMLVVR